MIKINISDDQLKLIKAIKGKNTLAETIEMLMDDALWYYREKSLEDTWDIQHSIDEVNEYEKDIKPRKKSKKLKNPNYSSFVTDTHPIIRYLCGRKNSDEVNEIFDRANNGEKCIIIPAIVVLETALLFAKGTVKINYSEILKLVPDENIKKNESWTVPAFYIADHDINCIIHACQIGYSIPDVYDKLITATAMAYDMPLITRDEAIQNSKKVITI
jgi:predicted nucleic acid-binding protein